MSGPSVLVTGGAGYIGSHVTAALVEQGFRPTVLDDLSTGLRDAAPAGVRLVQGDVGDQPLLEVLLAELRPTAVLHFAGSTSAPESVAAPLRYYENNTGKSRRLIEAVLASPSRPAILFSSSAAVYGAPDVTRVDEDAPTRPINPYGMSKLMTEQMMADAARAHGLAYVALRYFNVAGCRAGARSGSRVGAPGSLLSVALEALAGERAHVPVYGSDHPTADGTGVRDYIHVEDLAAAHLAVLPLLGREGAPRVLNCGYGRGWSVLQVLEAVERVSGRRLPCRFAPRRAGDPSEVVADNARILNCTSWRPSREDLRRIVSDALAVQPLLVADWLRTAAVTPASSRSIPCTSVLEAGMNTTMLRPSAPSTEKAE